MNLGKVRDYIEILVGVVIVAFGVQLFYVPHNLVTGGVTGIAIILLDISESMFGAYIPLWVTNISINLPLLLLSYKMMGKDIFIKTLFAIVTFTIALSLVAYVPDIETDITLAVVFGSGLIGVGMAFVLRCGATSGGTVLLAAIIHKFMKHVKLSSILFFIDFAIVMAGMFLFGPVMAMYAIIAIVIFVKVMDVVISGFQSAKAAFILSSKHDEVSKALLASINRGITVIPARGAYSGISKDMLLCIMSQKELIKAKEIVKDIDPDAFVMVTSVTEVLGNGFMPLE